MTPNYALERPVKSCSERAAGARTIIAPAARRPRSAAAAQRGRWASMNSIIPTRMLIALALLAVSVPALSTQFHSGPVVEARHTFLLMHEGALLPFTVEAKLTTDHRALAEMVVHAPWGLISVPGKAFVGIPDPDLTTMTLALLGSTPAREHLSVHIFYGPPDTQSDRIYEETRRLLTIEIHDSKATHRYYLTVPDSREIEEDL